MNCAPPLTLNLLSNSRYFTFICFLFLSFGGAGLGRAASLGAELSDRDRRWQWACLSHRPSQNGRGYKIRLAATRTDPTTAVAFGARVTYVISPYVLVDNGGGSPVHPAVEQGLQMGDSILKIGSSVVEDLEFTVIMFIFQAEPQGSIACQFRRCLSPPRLFAGGSSSSSSTSITSPLAPAEEAAGSGSSGGAATEGAKETGRSGSKRSASTMRASKTALRSSKRKEQQGTAGGDYDSGNDSEERLPLF